MISETQESLYGNETLQSKAIEGLRCVLVILVICTHIDRIWYHDMSGIDSIGYNLITSIFSWLLPTLIVPTFFFLSGYLFFYKVKSWNVTCYKTKVKRRLKTIVLPYLYWNLIAFAIGILLLLIKCLKNDVSISVVYDYTLSNIIHALWDIVKWPAPNWCFGLFAAPDNYGPADLPLWYLRNLFVMILFSYPLYYILAKRGKMLLSVLLVFYISNIWIQNMIFEIRDVFFFALGCYMGMNKMWLYQTFRPYFGYAICMAVVMGCICLSLLFYGNENLAWVLMPFFVLPAFIVLVILVHIAISKGKCKKLVMYSSSVFFVYCIHALVVNMVCARCINYLLFVIVGIENATTHLLAYCSSIICTLILCVVVFNVLRRLSPNTLNALTGYRRAVCETNRHVEIGAVS